MYSTTAGAGSSVGGRAAAESDFTPGVPGSWVPVGGAGGGWVWAMRGRGVVLPCLPPRPAPSPQEALGVTWLKNNVSVQDRRHMVTAAGHLNITKVIHRRTGMTDEGEYRCLVTTPAGVITSAPITLRVASLTKNFVVSPSNVTVLVGEALRLSCQIGLPAPCLTPVDPRSTTSTSTRQVHNPLLRSTAHCGSAGQRCRHIQMPGDQCLSSARSVGAAA
ncbi:protogenin A-like [Scylla paramamosain]|uniref:protogenin A-like n=1 Tax=Scylla paramamosain TaxID=85552 RepID=UPI0030838608